MHRIGVQEGHEEAPLPCDYFDLIGGTSMGGLVIMMSRRPCAYHFLASLRSCLAGLECWWKR